MTNRIIDQNGFITIPENPITCVGVFPYLGAQIDPTGADPDIDPGKIYQVYRPADELTDPDCMKSFEMIPFVDDHAMLGAKKDGLLPAEQKGVQGTTTETVAFRDGVLYSGIRIFSEALKNLIDQGKKALSIGYRCKYQKQPGIFAGQAYDFIQRSLRGNHLALVEKGRAGPGVVVLDSIMTMDSFDLNINQKEKTMPTIEELEARITAQDAALAKLTAALDEAAEKEKEEKAEDEDEKKEDEKKAEDEGEKKEDKKEDKDMDAALEKIAAMDAEIALLKKGGIKAILSEVSARDVLAAKLSHHIGTFDAADKTLDEVASYGVEKLGLKCDKGQEHATLNGFLHNRSAPGSAPAFSMDAAPKSSSIDAYLTPKS